MKFLCVCRGGNVRSHAMAYVLHDLHEQEAIAIGVDRVSDFTLGYLCLWADRIVVMHEPLLAEIPADFKEKVRLVDVGEDRWGVYVAPDLLDFLKEVAEDWKAKEFKI